MDGPKRQQLTAELRVRQEGWQLGTGWRLWGELEGRT